MGRSFTFVACILAVLLTAESHAQTVPAISKVARAVSTDTVIAVDGALDEPAWILAPRIANFLQRDPREGAPARERTEVRILNTTRSVFFGIRCDDSEPARVLATELRRGNDHGEDHA